ncbi:c-type cytochrome [Brevundimonas sp.]|uniref:cytochrome c oxidase subunit II n=1 Tax=Brevundimonas sp. TaxID=1871086 RepID=UPI0025CE108B|nr:c-type cytochrome [Brevundimonas sp.]
MTSRPTSTPSMMTEALAGWPPPVLDPAGPAALSVTILAWALMIMAAGVLLVVVAALGLGLFGGQTWKRRLGHERLIWIAGLGFPVVVLSALLVWGLSLTSRLTPVSTGDEIRIRVTGEMWWFRVAYLDEDGRELFQSANEVRIPAGRPVVFELESADVVHSFWVPRLSGKLDMIPGRRNILRLQADEPGAYGGQCAEYCGGPHALMGFMVIAMPGEAYDQWFDREQQDRAPPTGALQSRGQAVFMENGCAACHAIRGTQAAGLAGPDLSTVGSRAMIGAGILDNNRGTLAGWVADSQTIKPGNRMPTYRNLSGEDLQAVAAYLEGLR